MDATSEDYRVQIEPRALTRLAKLAKRVQCRFWALIRDLVGQGPRPLGWPSLTEAEAESYCCHLDYRYVAGWLVISDRTVKIDAPAVSLGKLAYLQEAAASEVHLSLQNPPVDLRVTGAGTPQFLSQLRERYPGQMMASRDLLELPNTEWYRALEREMSAGKCLHIYRQNAGLNLRALSDICGIPRPQLAAWEDGLEPLAEADALQLALYLECDHRSLLLLA